MGTRADFYIKKENIENLEYCGSIAFDGYDIGKVAKAKNVNDFRNKLLKFSQDRNDFTYPFNGWPWPWNNSKLTDEVYIFIADKKGNGKVWRAFEMMGKYDDNSTPLIFAPIDKFPKNNEFTGEYETPKKSIEILMPDMSHIKNIAHGNRSGLIEISI